MDNQIPPSQDELSHVEVSAPLQSTAAPLSKWESFIHNLSKPYYVVGFAVLMVLLGGGIALVAYKSFIERHQQKPGATATQQPVEKQSTLILSELTARLSAGELTTQGSGPTYQVPGDEYVVVAKGSPRITFERSASAAPAAAVAIAQFFSSKKFTEKVITKNTESAYVISIYTNPELACELTREYQAINDKTNPVSLTITCREKTEMKRISTIIKPLYAAYLASSPTRQGGIIMFSEPKISVSKSKGYASAEMSTSVYTSIVGGYVGLYYKTPDGKWHYFKGTQQALPCKDYATNDLKKAFEGATCYADDTGNLAKVKP